MIIDDIQFKNDALMVDVLKTKTYVPRQFIITQRLWIDLVKKYYHLRPSHITHRRFFLKLPNPEIFTGHCFRRSSVTHLANSGVDLITIKRHGGWESSAVAEGYIDNSIKKKLDVAEILSSTAPNKSTKITENPSTSNSIDNDLLVNVNQPGLKQNIVCSQNLPGISINAHESSSVTVKVYNNCSIHNDK